MRLVAILAENMTESVGMFKGPQEQHDYGSTFVASYLVALLLYLPKRIEYIEYSPALTGICQRTNCE